MLVQPPVRGDLNAHQEVMCVSSQHPFCGGLRHKGCLITDPVYGEGSCQALFRLSSLLGSASYLEEAMI